MGDFLCGGNLPVCCLTAGECDRDVPHRRIGLGAMPMAFTSLDMDDVTDIDLPLLTLRCHHAGARGNDQHLVAVMGMPPVVQPWLKFTTLQL
jgi:hypothetical protein